MQNNVDRAKQFLPFDALKGFREMLSFVEKQKMEKKQFTGDFIEVLNNKINRLQKGMNVKVTYYFDLNYIETFGIIKRIDNINKTIILLNTKINFDDIMDIEFME